MFGGTMPKMMYVKAAAVNTKDNKTHWTTSCIDCGKCEKHCPQHIEVRKELKLVNKKLEGFSAKILAFMLKRFS